MTTKEQERQALIRIRKIVESLGDNSYIGVALDGCLDMAAENIENDWGCSMLDRAQKAEAKVVGLEGKCHDYQVTVEELSKRITDLEGARINKEALSTISSVLSQYKNDTESKLRQFAQGIVDNADHPNDIAFQNAVRWHRHYEKAIGQIEFAHDQISQALKH